MGGSCIKEKIIRESNYDTKSLQVKEKDLKNKDANVDQVNYYK
jgi:hypothetical protein